MGAGHDHVWNFGKTQDLTMQLAHAPCSCTGGQAGSHARSCTTTMCGPVGGRVMSTRRDPKLLRDGSDVNSQCHALVWVAYVAAGCGLCSISANAPRFHRSICRSVESQMQGYERMGRMVDVFPSAKCMRNAVGFDKVTFKILQELQIHDLQNVQTKSHAPILRLATLQGVVSCGHISPLPKGPKVYAATALISNEFSCEEALYKKVAPVYPSHLPSQRFRSQHMETVKCWP